MIKTMIISSENTLVLSTSINRWYESHPSIRRDDILDISFTVENGPKTDGHTYRYVVTYEERDDD